MKPRESVRIYAHTGPNRIEYIYTAGPADYQRVLMELQMETPSWAFFPLITANPTHMIGYIGRRLSHAEKIEGKAGRPRKSGDSQRGGGSPLLSRPGTAEEIEEVSPETPLAESDQSVGADQAP
jgi:hypothetical protein